MPRPALVVADGPFADVAWEAGIDVIALAGLDRPALAVAANRDGRGRRRPAADGPTGRGPTRVIEDLGRRANRPSVRPRAM